MGEGLLEDEVRGLGKRYRGLGLFGFEERHCVSGENEE